MARDQVTGTFGNEKVTLNNAATEATLRQLLNHFEKVSGSDTQAKDKLKKLGESAKNSSEHLKDWTKKLKRSENRFTRGIGHTAEAAFGLTKTFIDGSTSLGEFSNHLTGLIKQVPVFGGVLGETIQAFVNVVDGQIEVFRGLSSVGVTFGDSLFDTLSASTRANLALSTFTGVISSSATSLAVLEGSANRGARTFRDVSAQVQENARNFAALGLTVEETAEFQADFLDIQTRLGQAQERNATVLGRQTVDYINNLDELSRLTGRQRDEISKSLQQETLDRRISALLTTLEPEARRQLQTITQTLEARSPEVAEAFREMVATGGVPLSEFGQDLLRTNSRLGEMARGLRDGSVSAEQVMAEFRRTADIANNMGDSQMRLFATTAALGNTVGAAVLEMRGFTNIGEGLNEVQQERLDAEEKGANALLAFDAALLQTRNEIIGRLIESNVFSSLEKRFEGLMAKISDNGEFLDRLANGISGVINWIDQWIFGLIAGEKDLDEVLSHIGEKMSDFFTAFFQKGLEALGTAISNMFSDASNLAKAGILGLFVSPVLVKAASAAIAGLFAKAGAAGATTAAAGGRMIGPRAGVGLGAATAIGAQFIPSEEQGDSGDIARSSLSMAGTGAMLGAMLGPKGALIGAGVGGVLGLGTGAFRRLTRGADEADEQVEKLAESHKNLANAEPADIDSLKSLTEFTPKINKLTQSIGGFESTFNSLDIDTLKIDNANQSLDKMVEKLEEINNQLQGGDQGFFDRLGNRNQPTAGDVLTADSDRDEKLEEVNRTLVDILGVLMQTHDIDRRQLNATRAMTNNLYAGS